MRWWAANRARAHRFNVERGKHDLAANAVTNTAQLGELANAAHRDAEELRDLVAGPEPSDNSGVGINRHWISSGISRS